MAVVSESQTVCVTGMPGSGVSVVASVLSPDRLVDTSAFVRLNEQILAALGGSWQIPPSLNGNRREALMRFADTARETAAEALSSGAPAWADPQTLLIADLWQYVDPTLRFVVAIRNPLETVLSLRQRHGVETSSGFALCLSYLRCAADLIPPKRRLVVHYDTVLLDPRGQAARLLAHAGSRISHDALAHVTEIIAPERQHFHASVLDLLAARPPRELLDLYGLLCLEAGHEREAEVLETTFEGQPDHAGADGDKAGGSIVRIAELAEMREQFRARAETSEERRAAAESELARVSGQLEAAQRRAEAAEEEHGATKSQLEFVTTQLEETRRLSEERAHAFVQTLRSVVRDFHPGSVLEWLDEAELVKWTRMTEEERVRLGESNAALLAELHAVNRHRAQLIDDLTSIWASESWKIGRAFTWLARVLLRRGTPSTAPTDDSVLP